MIIIKQLALEKLKNSVFLSFDKDETPKHYLSDQVWIDRFFDNEVWEGKVNKKDYFLSDSISLKEGSSETDIENIKIIHGELKHFSPRILVDERIWTYLSHKTFYSYMYKRWDPAKADIKTRYFLQGTSSRALARNGIARLWFLGHLTYDESHPNPYEVTEMMMQRQDVMVSVIERPSTSMNKIFLNSIIRLIFNENLSRSDYDDLMKKINRISGIKRLDSFNQKEMDEYLKQII